jgi:hypothetical protein
MANVIIVTQPQSVFVDEGTSSVTFSTSGITTGTTLSGRPVVYRWFTKNGGTGSPSLVSGQTNPTLTLSPVANFDNDTFYAGLSAGGADSEVLTDEVTFAIRLSGDQYKDWETATESGANRVRRLSLLGYL